MSEATVTREDIELSAVMEDSRAQPDSANAP